MAESKPVWGPWISSARTAGTQSLYINHLSGLEFGQTKFRVAVMEEYRYSQFGFESFTRNE